MKQSEEFRSRRMHHGSWFSRAMRNLSSEEGVVPKIEKMKQRQGLYHTWDKLGEIEEQRREVLSRKDATLLGSLLYWNGTVMSGLAHQPFFFILIALYISLRAATHYLEKALLQSVARADITLLGGFLSFFLSLYVNNANARFHAMYDMSRACQAAIMDLANLARHALPQEMSLRLVRYMNAAHLAGYVGLSLTYRDDNFFKPQNKRKSLLTPSEIQRIRTIDLEDGSAAYHEILAWAMDEVMRAHIDLKLLDNPLANMFRSKVFAFRTAMEGLYNYNDQPQAFFYVNFISLLAFLYLPLFTGQVALSTGVDPQTGEENYHWTTEISSALLVLFQSVYILGLRYIAHRLSEPYGDDVEDLSVLSYVNEAWEDSRRLLACQIQPVASLQEELQFADQALESIGRPWGGRGGKGERVSIDGSGNTIETTKHSLELGAFDVDCESAFADEISAGTEELAKPLWV